MSDLNEQLIARIDEAQGIVRLGSSWTGNETAFAPKEEADVAMLDDLLSEIARLARRAPAAAPAPVAAITELPDAEEYFRSQLSESGIKKYLAEQPISLTTAVWCEIMQDYARAALAAAPQAQAAQQPVAKVVETDIDVSVVDAVLPVGQHLYAAPVVAAAQVVDVIYKLMGACLIDWTEGEEFNTDAAERAFLMAKVQELIATPAAPVAPSEQDAGTITIPVAVARLIDLAFLPSNPNKLRAARDDVKEAAKAFKAAVAAAPAANPEPDGDLGAAHDAEGG